MAEQSRTPGFFAQSNQPLIGVIVQKDGQDLVCYFTDEATADEVLSPETIQAALSLIGAWSDLDWDEMEAALDRIRHESPPTPPIEL